MKKNFPIFGPSNAWMNALCVCAGLWAPFSQAGESPRLIDLPRDFEIQALQNIPITQAVQVYMHNGRVVEDPLAITLLTQNAGKGTYPFCILDIEDPLQGHYEKIPKGYSFTVSKVENIESQWKETLFLDTSNEDENRIMSWIRCFNMRYGVASTVEELQKIFGPYLKVNPKAKAQRGR